MSEVKMNEREKLVAELEEKQSLIAEMRDLLTTKYSNLPRILRGGVACYDSPEYRKASELREAISGAEARIVFLQESIARFDKVAAYQARVQSSANDAKLAHAAALEAEHRAAELGQRAAKLTAKVEALEAEALASEDEAVAAEAGAARVFATAVATGNESAEKTASALLVKAQAQAAAVRGRAASTSVTINALRDELAALEGQIQTAKGEAADHHQRSREATLTGLQASWDERAKALLADAARIRTLRHANGYGWGVFRDLNIPLFGVGGRDRLSEDDIDKASFTAPEHDTGANAERETGANE